MIDLNLFESGDFKNCNEKKLPTFLRLFFFWYQCNQGYIVRNLLELDKDVKTSSAWKNRIRIFLALLMLHREEKGWEKLIKTINPNELECGDSHYSFFASLYNIILKNSEIIVTEQKSGRSISLIGDSHTVSMSRVFSKDNRFDIYYLPGIMLKGICSKLNNSYKQALIEAFSISQRKNKIILSIGEIDQRYLYLKEESLLKNEEKKKKLNKIMANSFNFIESILNPSIETKINLLPPFHSKMLKSESNKNLTEDSINHFNELFYKHSKKIGLSLPQDETSIFESEINYSPFLIDHTHVSPLLYSQLQY